jgi:FkbM family methyltransferase
MLRSIKNRLSVKIKKLVMQHYLIPFSETGLNEGLVRYLATNSPINLIDVGASSGEFTNTVQKYCGIRHALLIEPQPRRASELARRFSDDRFIIKQCAVSNVIGTANMDILAFDYASSLLPIKRAYFGLEKIIDTNIKEQITVEINRIDDLVATLPWGSERIDLLKIDVQGGELSALNGAVNTLERTDMVWTEISFRPIYEGSALFSDIHSFFTEAGFILLWLAQGFRGESGELLQGDALFLSPSQKSM